MINSTNGVAVGIGTLAMKTTDGGLTWATRKTNTSLRQQLSLNAVTCSPANTNLCFAVGGGSYPTSSNATRFISKSTDGGESWVKQDSANGSQTFFGVSCNSDTSCVAVGGTTTTTRYYAVLQNSGATWTATSTASNSLLNAVYCIPGGTLCYAVGGTNATTPRIQKFTNTSGVWAAVDQTPAGAGRLNGIHCLDADNCYAVGNAGVILKTTDASSTATWSALTSGTTKNLSAISCTSASTCVAVGKAIGSTVYVGGDVSVILKTTDGGANWASKSVAALNDSLYAVKFADANNGVIVGANGIVLRSTDAGETWTMNANSRKLAMNVNGSYDFVSAGSGSGKGDNYSMSSWANVTAATGGQRTVFGKGDFHWTQQVTSANLWNSAERNWMACTGTPATMCAFNGNTNWQNAETGMSLVTGWHYTVSRRKNSVDSGIVYRDGGTLCGGSQVAAANASGGGVELAAAQRSFLDIVAIGRGSDAYRRFWNRGSLDEIRMDGV
ncbi:MAG TPA: YCF48-related protein, partial [Flavobacteriales bacterium]|nr:YCF48-related protein [Flavobacteriales bacterium]